MKKNFFVKMLLVLALVVSSFAGCSFGAQDKASGKNGKIKIVCTTYPQYDWVNNIIGKKKDNFDVELLIKQGVDLHSYQPSAKDIANISTADMFIYVGGESDEWVDDVLKTAKNKKIKSINMVKAIGKAAKEEEVVEGMEPEKEDEKEDSKDNKDEEEVEIDEHVWLSLRNAKTISLKIEKELEKIDPANKETYKKNSDSYVKRLDDLDAKYKKTVESSNKKAVVFGDRFPFRYMVNDYDIKYYAAFVGCSAESEASFKTISFLAKKVDDLDTDVIFVIENSDKKIANTIKKNTHKKNQKILVMNSLQSITQKDLDNGLDYISVMEKNLEVLKQAL